MSLRPRFLTTFIVFRLLLRSITPIDQRFIDYHSELMSIY
ncbi:hypothetical protein PALB_18540 [Pseudoalteromonas luteoviolacea B = ATCC 29581]|nr:hypothetical protein PALB_18540 [Pseudoalteromonas luteoviolacea B = ATCC 29581]